VGYSGHEQDLDPTVAAVTLGARVIERHITLSHEMWGTDQKASLTVSAMGMLGGRIKEIHEMLGNGERHMGEEEMEARKRLRGD
jgi:N-acetylneuraminate synthase